MAINSLAAMIFVAAGVVYLAAGMALFYFQRSFIYHPKRFLREDATKIISFLNDGALIKVSVHENEQENALVYFAGNSEDVTLALPRYKAAFPGYALYMIHYRGYGGSTGEATEAALKSDAEKLYGYVQSSHSHRVVVGRSLGSGIAIHVAAKYPVAKLVLISPYDSVLNIGKQMFPFFPVGFLLKDRYESWRSAPDVTAPTTIIATAADEIIPFENTKALIAAFKPGIVQLHRLDDSNHVTIDSNPGYFRLMQ